MASAWFVGTILLVPLALTGLPEVAPQGPPASEDPTPAPAPIQEPPEDPPQDPTSGTGDESGSAEGSEQTDQPEPEEPEERAAHAAPTETPPPAQAGSAPGSEPPPGALAPGLTAPEVQVPATPEPARLPDLSPRYRSLAEVLALVEAFAAAAPGPARVLDLGTSHGGLAVPALEFGAEGPVPLVERPTVLLLGGLDGRSLAGGEAVLAAVHALLRTPADLPPNVSFVALPWASPGPLARIGRGTGDGRDGGNGRPTDSDRDGLLDEDGPDDLDGDGVILDMLIEHPDGPWVRAGDGRFLVPARAGDGTRYLWTREGKDDDGDGRFNEDPAGGVVLDRNFPVRREGPWQDPSVGRLPMSEPLARAIADLAHARRTVLVLLFQGNHGSVATPNGAAAADEQVYRRVTEAFLAATGRVQTGPLTLEQARGVRCPGAAIDWFHEVLGALTLEVAPWGPGVEGASAVTVESAQFSTQSGGETPRALEGRPRLGEREDAWAAWLDNTRGGLGFVDWQPVELGGGRQGLVGGWQPFTIENPPAESLAAALVGLPEFVVDLAASLPQLEVRASSTRDGNLCRVRAQIKNLGLLPTGLSSSAQAAPLALDLQLPPGAQLVAGELHVEFDQLLGRELSRELSWVVVAPVGSVLRLTATSAWTGSVEREVKP